MSNKLSFLFEKMKIKELWLPNRFVMAPMTRSQAKGHIPNEAMAQYYARRVRGGVGLVITEGIEIPHIGSSGYESIPRISTYDELNGWEKVVKEIHLHGGKVFGQLWHVGSIRAQKTQQDVYGPSEIIHPYLQGKTLKPPRALPNLEIEKIMKAFALAASNAHKVGMDGIEIHGAHGYLLDQFFWSKTNQRKEEDYGGQTPALRTRFACEVIEEIRRNVPESFPISFRFSQWKLGGYEEEICHDHEELKQFLEPLKKSGVDVFHVSTRNFSHTAFKGSEESDSLARLTKKKTKCPVIAVGSFMLNKDFVEQMKLGQKSVTDYRENGPESVAHEIKTGGFDFMAVGRSLISDPDLVHKIEIGDFKSIIPFDKGHLKTYF